MALALYSLKYPLHAYNFLGETFITFLFDGNILQVISSCPQSVAELRGLAGVMAPLNKMKTNA
jgi:hypothetical protein